MAAEIDFQPYLQSISSHYAQWWQLYTLTDAETKTQQQNESKPWKTPFDFGLMVQTVKCDRPSGMEGSGGESKAKEKIERFPVLEGIRKYVKEYRQVLLVGRPGSGKSTTLARLLLEEARNVEDPPSPLKKGEPEVKVPLFKGDLGRSKGLGDSASLIPVLVELRFLSDSTILDRIQAFFQRHGLQLDRTQIKDLLFHQRLLLLMDGLNELPSEAARLDVTRFRQDYPKVSMIFTTRDLRLGGDFGLEKKLEMQPLTEAQMQEFVRSYVPEQAEVMLRQLKDRLREFGQTPLLLWMLCELFRQTGQIPTNLGEVFRAFTQGYEKNLKADVPVESDRRWWPELLQELAFWMMRGVPFGEEAPAVDIEFRVSISKSEVRQIFAAFLQNKEAQAEGAAQKYLDDLLRHHLIQSNEEQVEFRHQLLQEYYAAKYLLSRLDQICDFELKQQYLNCLKWTEPLKIATMFLETEDFTLRLINLALDVDFLLGACLAGSVNQDFQETTVQKIDSLDVSQWFKVELLLKTHSEFAVSKIQNACSNQMRERVISGLGTMGCQAALPVLIEILLESEQRSLRSDAAYALGFLGNQEAIPALKKALEDTSLAVQAGASFALRELGVEQPNPISLRYPINDADAQQLVEIFKRLSSANQESINLCEVLENEDAELFHKVAPALENIKSKDAACALSTLLAIASTRNVNLAFPALKVLNAIQNNLGFYNYDLTQITKFSSTTEKPSSNSQAQVTNITNNDFRGANIGNFAENQYGTQQTTQIHPHPSQPPETPQ
jgi:energy-coupling factor transporter ATP-binding protein EcfA2